MSSVALEEYITLVMSSQLSLLGLEDPFLKRVWSLQVMGMLPGSGCLLKDAIELHYGEGRIQHFGA